MAPGNTVTSPYGTQAASVAVLPAEREALLPFEQRQIDNMLNQFRALSPDLQRAFMQRAVHTH
jgi:hypothetical protein